MKLFVHIKRPGIGDRLINLPEKLLYLLSLEQVGIEHQIFAELI